MKVHTVPQPEHIKLPPVPKEIVDTFQLYKDVLQLFLDNPGSIKLTEVNEMQLAIGGEVFTVAKSASDFRLSISGIYLPSIDRYKNDFYEGHDQLFLEIVHMACDCANAKDGFEVSKAQALVDKLKNRIKND